MKNHQWLRTFLCCLLVLCTVFALCACPANVPDDGDKPNPPPDDSNKPGDGDQVPDAYGNGGEIKGAGATIPEGSTALVAAVYDPAKAEDVVAASFFRSADKAKGKVFRVSNGETVSLKNAGGQVYDGAGSILIAPQGLVISGCHDVVFRNITIIGSVLVENTNGLIMENVEIVSEATALSVDAATAKFKMSDCRLTGKTALSLAADDSTVLNTYMAFTEAGVVDSAQKGTTILHCILEGSGVGITSGASEAAYKNLTIHMGKQDKGIVLSEGMQNTLVALNVIKEAQQSVLVTGATNTVVILSSVVSIEANNNRNLYICDNAMGGRLTANNNNYFLADNNTTPKDAWTHKTVQTGNTNTNGDSLMDVTARLDVGADENQLPHIDKDLFVGVERKSTVKDVTAEKEVSITEYILTHAKTDDYVILAPGVYATDAAAAFRAEHSHTTIYGYGVYMERQKGLSQLISYSAAEDISIKGLTIGFKQQTCGQVYVLEKLGYDTVRVVTGAGMMNEFGNSNTAYYNTTGMGAQRMGTFYAYCDTGFNSIKKDITIDGVPTMIMKVSPSVCEMLEAGDILTCRASNGGTTISVGAGSKDIKFIDFNIYGCAAGFAYVENDALTATTYYRVCDTTQNGFLIDETTYQAYRALENRYNVNLEVEIDDLGRFRGSPAHIGSIDATHTTRCAEGSLATSCLFENMCDDATNQNANHGRLAEVRDNGDGTTTIVYKGNFSQYAYETRNNQPIDRPYGFCANFRVGDRVFVYTNDGQLVCDTEALTATRSLGDFSFNWKDHGYAGGVGTVEKREVVVSTSAVNFEAVNRFNLDDNSHYSTNKVLIDNMSLSSNGFVFDNCKFQNIRSRGLLIKASNGKVLNCTFRNIGMSCGAILYEIYWGESGVSENLLIDRNLFDHTGYFNNIDLYATISITGLGSNVAEDYLLYKNIVISNNRMINRTTDYAIYVNSAKDVVIKDNYFGEFVGNDFTYHPEEPETESNPKPVIHINGAMNIEISGNRYPETGFIQDQIVAKRNKNVFGSDVELDGIPLIPDNIR